ncbi:hypothetical protein Cob_v007073 [Colletotrichum orbiculare MAFF 240422]|uniref:C6 transcription factor n=1 Tax=Colletotrichum orbiculare (strain 104-T / ATCC 96160 / CBS 514.97 / LARS 414 / MAFF 240422) TaxID=1213857 RepID=A0A484FSC6_COLOR|nr:hypothetical protein Cob_v007073 [Colletotrichum orbiculare MAFF 240422]
MHAGSLLNLYRCFLNFPSQLAEAAGADISGAIAQCVNSGQSCIHAAEMVRDLVPTSHYLAICVNYLTISCIILLRMPPDQTDSQMEMDVHRCCSVLQDLEHRWSGARQSRTIIERLIQRRRCQNGNDYTESSVSGGNSGGSRKRDFADYEGGAFAAAEEGVWWRDIIGYTPFPSRPSDPA